MAKSKKKKRVSNKEQAIADLVDWVLEMEQDDFFEEAPDPSRSHPWYLAHRIKFGKASAELKLQWARKNAGLED